jgi:hypothetical protein
MCAPDPTATSPATCQKMFYARLTVEIRGVEVMVHEIVMMIVVHKISKEGSVLTSARTPPSSSTATLDPTTRFFSTWKMKTCVLVG